MKIEEFKATFEQFPIVAVKKILYDYPRDTDVMDFIINDKEFLTKFCNEKRLFDHEVKKSYRSILFQALLEQEDLTRIKAVLKNASYVDLKKVFGRQGFYILKTGNFKLIDLFLKKDLIPQTVPNFKLAYMFNPIDVAKNFPPPTTLYRYLKECNDVMFNSGLDVAKVEHLKNVATYYNNGVVQKDYIFNNMSSFKDEVLENLLIDLYKKSETSLTQSEKYNIYTEIARGKTSVLKSIIKGEIKIDLEDRISTNDISNLSVAPKYNSNDGIHMFPLSMYLPDEKIGLVTLSFLNHNQNAIDYINKRKHITPIELEETKRIINKILNFKDSNYIKQSLKLINKFEIGIMKKIQVEENVKKSTPNKKYAWGNNKLN